MGSDPMYLMFLQKGTIWTKRQTFTGGRQCEDTEGEDSHMIGVMFSTGQGTSRTASTYQMLQEAREYLFLKPPECMALVTPRFWTSSLPNGETIHFCQFKTPSLWYFVMQP